MAEERADHRPLAEVVESWAGRAVLVVGDAMLDEWRFAESDGLCREAPAPVLTLRHRIVSAGGAANTAVNLAALDGRAALVAPVGADVAGDDLHDCLDRAGVRDRTVTQSGRPTPIKRRMLAADQILLREDEGAPDGLLPPGGTRRLIRSIACAVDELRAETGERLITLVICDYGLGALPAAVRSWLVSHRGSFGTVALDAHDLSVWQGLTPTVVTPSFAEATRLLEGGSAGRLAATAAIQVSGSGSGQRQCPTGTETGDSLEPAERVVLARSRLAELRERTGAAVVAVTLDTDGAVVGGADGQHGRSHATPVPASYAVGAGDAYLATMTLALAAGAALPTAAHLAQLAASSTVSDTGTCVCRRDDLLAALSPSDPDPATGPGSATGPDPTTDLGSATGPDPATDLGSASSPEPATDPGPASPGRSASRGVPVTGVMDRETLVGLVQRHRAEGRTVVFTNGCFDVLHPGHVRYLEQARELGDLLVVAVNSDDSVCRLKGPGRPVNPVADRAAVLAALSCVDHVVVFEEDSPSRLIEAVRPDLYVKGGDYPPEMVPEAPLIRRLGGQVRTLGYVPDRSTSAIIDRIRAHGADRVAGPVPGDTPAPGPVPGDAAAPEPVPTGAAAPESVPTGAVAPGSAASGAPDPRSTDPPAG